MLAISTVLWRTGSHSFSITGWGWLALMIVVGALSEIGRNR